jgi:hypothetical protein
VPLMRTSAAAAAAKLCPRPGIVRFFASSAEEAD